MHLAAELVIRGGQRTVPARAATQERRHGGLANADDVDRGLVAWPAGTYAPG